MTPLLPVDPSEAERLIERFCVGNGRFFRAFLANSQPDARGSAMISGKPFAKLRGRPKAKNFAFLQIVTVFQKTGSLGIKVRNG